MKLIIMDYNSLKQEVEIPDDVWSIKVAVISGDESLHYVTQSGDVGSVYHDTAQKCNYAFFDGSYYIFDNENGVDLINSWNNRFDSYEFMDELWEKQSSPD